MDFESVINLLLDELVLVAKFEPNERLPKEEQIRCVIYASIRPKYDVVCAERGYDSINNGSRIEIDLWACSEGGTPVWIEIKRCWAVRRKGWNNNVAEKLADWNADISKLARDSQVNADRYFVLVGFFSEDPRGDASARHLVVRAIESFYPETLVHSAARAFLWLTDDGISHVGAWVWHWPVGQHVWKTTDG